MNEETPEKVALDMIAQADVLAMMGPQPLSSLKVIEQLKKFAERILSAVKPDELRSRMEPTAGSGAFFTNEKVLKEVAELVKPCEKPLDPNAPEMVRGNSPAESAESAEGEEFEKKAIGNFAGVGKVVSYAIGRDMTVTVTANTTGDGAWMFKGIKNGETEIIGTVIGGKWKAMQYCKFIRNGIVSRANRLYHAHHKAKKETT